MKVLWITLHDPEDHRLRHNSIGLAQNTFCDAAKKRPCTMPYIERIQLERRNCLFFFVKQLSREVFSCIVPVPLDRGNVVQSQTSLSYPRKPDPAQNRGARGPGK